MKCLVTGGAGFIGSHLVDLLLSEGHSVVVVDNYSTGRPANLAHQNDNAQLKLVEADINDMSKTLPLYQGIDWVFHLAALADIVPSIERPLEYHRANVDGTMAVLECARAARVKRLVYAASSSCYGIPEAYPTPETAEIAPQYPYALSKNLGEQCVLNWAKIYRMSTVSLRFFNVYGPRSRTSGTYGAMFGVFLAQKLHGKPLTVVGDGEQTRDFTYVSDVADAILAAAESNVSGEVLNVGSGNHYSVNSIVRHLGGEVVHIPKRPGEPDATFADIAKIRRLTGWTPKVSIEQGIQLMLSEIEYWREAPVWTPESISKATASWFEHLR